MGYNPISVPLNDAERAYCEEHIANLPYIAIVTDLNNRIVYVNKLCKLQLSAAHVQTDLYDKTGYTPHENVLELRRMYDKTFLVSSVYFEIGKKGLFLNSLMPDIVLTAGDFAFCVDDSKPAVEKLLRATLEYNDSNYYSKKKLTNFIHVMNDNYENEDFARGILSNFLRDYHKIFYTNERSCDLNIVVNRMISYADIPLKRLGIDLEIKKDPRFLYMSIIDPNVLLYTFLCVINYCIVYCGDNLITVEMTGDKYFNYVRFSIRDSMNALEIYNNFFLRHPGYQTMYSLSYAFAPFAVVNSIIERANQKISYIAIGGRLHITIGVRKSECGPDLILHAPDLFEAFKLADTPEQTIFSPDYAKKARSLLFDLKKLISDNY